MQNAQLFVAPGDFTATGDSQKYDSYIADSHIVESRHDAIFAALDGLRVAITVFRPDNTLLYANQHYNYMFASLPHRDRLCGTTYEELIRHELACGEIALSDLADGPEAFVARRLHQLQAMDYHPFDVHLADGRIIEIKARRAGDGTSILLWSDATHARHLLGRLEDAIALSADAFAFWDKSDRLLLCNDAFARLHGYHSEADVTGVTFASLIDEALKRERLTIEGDAAAWLSRRMDAHRAPAGALTVLMSDGTAYLVRERATRDGGSATVYTDVTERHRAESALNEQSNALLRTKRALEKTKSAAKKQTDYLADMTARLDAAEVEADTAKTALLRTMSHELKTPLNAILGFSDLLRSSPGAWKPDQIGEYAGLIHLAGGNLLRLINQILDLTKIAARRYVLNRSVIEANSALYAMADLYNGRADDRHIKLHIASCAPGLCVNADEAALNMMLGHLTENALNFTPPGGTVHLSADANAGQIRFRVEDNGPGVAEEDLARIIEPFEQVARGTDEHESGAGLGLPLVKGLAELHDGSLDIQSAKGEGFSAIVSLPAA